MKPEGKGNERLEFFKELFSEAQSYNSEFYEKLERHFEQYKGSSKIDGSAEAASQVRNITYEIIESQFTSYIPTPAVSPKMYSEKNERNAKSIETLLSNKRDELPFEKMNDIDERYNPIYGGSVWLVEWDNSILTHNTVGDVKLSCLSPRHFVGQPNIYDIDCMEYCFIIFETTKEDIVRKYGVSPAVADETSSEESSDDKTATLYVCYYKDDEDRVCEFIWSEDTVLLDLEDYFARKRRICLSCGEREELCRGEAGSFMLKNEEYEELLRDIPLSDGSFIPCMSELLENGQVVTEIQKQNVIDENGNIVFDSVGGVLMPMVTDVEVPKLRPTRLPFYKPSHFPVVIRKNTSEEDNLFGQSDCEFIRPQQQAINKLESRIMQKLMGSGVYPIVPDDFADSLDNSIFRRVFRAKQSNFKLFGRVDLQVDISLDVGQSDRIYDHAKRISGISDAYVGQLDRSAPSAKAKQLQIQQAAGRLESKRQMKNAAYAELDKIIFEYYLAYADEPRPSVFKDGFGRIQNRIFNRYDFLERDETGEYYYNDEYLFSAGAMLDIEKSKEFLWQENLKNFQMGTYGDPASPSAKLIYWMNQERSHYPWSHENVERLKEEISRQRQAEEYEAHIASLAEENQNRAGYEEYLLDKINKSGGVQNAAGHAEEQ